MNIFDFIKIFKETKKEFYADRDKAKECIKYLKAYENLSKEIYEKNKLVEETLDKGLYWYYPDNWFDDVRIVVRLLKWCTIDPNDYNSISYIEKLEILHMGIKKSRETCQDYMHSKTYKYVIEEYNACIEFIKSFEQNNRTKVISKNYVLD